ncbi:Velvet factor [Teratosphaeria destructans]|uniref:Velvet factor n=1 Tax=Teratosphaeria destructans TaxID=418781 RepID=A0A9W7SUN1_9PEZI|nr:Velvet factor [Teratosphaeria destructans]
MQVQVQASPQQQYYHARPVQAPADHHNHSNGVYSDTRAQSSVYTNGHHQDAQAGAVNDMNPYHQQQHYSHQHPQQAAQYPQQQSTDPTSMSRWPMQSANPVMTGMAMAPPTHYAQSQAQRQPPPQYQPQSQQQYQQASQQYPQQYQQQQPPHLPPMQTSGMGVSSMYGGAPMPGHMAAPQYGMYQNSSMTLPPPGPVQQNAPPIVPRSGSALFHIGSDENYDYKLVVEQQPQRARMCGFGDKDRRPITPPPCVRLIITNKGTDQEVGFDDVDGTFFVLQVDLWDDVGHKEVNIVRASSQTPSLSISNSTTTAYPPSDRVSDFAYGANGIPYQIPVPGAVGYGGQHPAYSGPVGASPMYTRNLIGSLTVNAARLKDPAGKESYWFVLQDLSVRTEGWFRLRMNFIDLRGKGTEASGLNKGKAPVLAWAFSDKFQVYSAKKFPGVIESTPLSKCFAQQGIKIPIRKDVKGEGDAKEEDGDDD